MVRVVLKTVVFRIFSLFSRKVFFFGSVMKNITDPLGVKMNCFEMVMVLWNPNFLK